MKETANSHMRRALAEASKLQSAGKLDAAAARFREIVAAHPDSADAWHRLGTVAFERHDLEEAQRAIGRAIELEPDNPTFLHNMASTVGQLGERTKARDLYRQAIRFKSDYAEAYYNLSDTVKFAPDDSFRDDIRALLARPDLSQVDQCFLHFAAAKFCDDVGLLDEAFAHYRRANELKGARFDRQMIDTVTNQTIETFSAEFLSRMAGGGHDSDKAIFVVGMPRSGTTLVEHILASHPSVFGAGELSDLNAIAGTIPRHVPDGGPYPACIRKASAEVLAGMGKAYIDRLTSLAPDAGRVVNKNPLNFGYLGLIALLVPNAKIVHCRRGAEDTCLSCYFKNFTKGQEYSFDLADLGFFYRRYERLMVHWSAALTAPIMNVQYEELVDDPEPVVRALVAHCGLDWDDACLRFHETKRAVHTASRFQVRQPIYSSAIDRWKRYQGHLGPLLEQLRT